MLHTPVWRLRCYIREAYNRLQESLSISVVFQGGFLPEMTRREAALILGLRESSAEEKVKDAHRKIMVANHPDAGKHTSLAYSRIVVVLLTFLLVSRPSLQGICSPVACTHSSGFRCRVCSSASKNIGPVTLPIFIYTSVFTSHFTVFLFWWFRAAMV